MYSLKYGTIPVVRATGGLDDSIQEYHADNEEGNGFKFEDYSARALLNAARRAIKVYDSKSSWDQLVQNAMAADFSWDRSAREYLTLYQKIAGL
jgi:starch synthase